MEPAGNFYLPLSGYNFTDFDSVFFEIPTGLKLETSLPDFKFESDFGTYTARALYENNRLFYSRKIVKKGGRYTDADNPGWIDFLKKIRKADGAQIVFVENKSRRCLAGSNERLQNHLLYLKSKPNI